MKTEFEVLKISISGKFHQYLKKSEVRFINDIAKRGTVTVELVRINAGLYKATFGTN